MGRWRRLAERLPSTDTSRLASVVRDVALGLIGLAALIAVLFLLAGCDEKPYDRLVRRCEAAGGKVVDYGPSGADCLVDGRFLTDP